MDNSNGIAAAITAFVVSLIPQGYKFITDSGRFGRVEKDIGRLEEAAKNLVNKETCGILHDQHSEILSEIQTTQKEQFKVLRDIQIEITKISKVNGK